MSDDENSLSGLSESVQFERELVESQYSSKNFEPDPENPFKYALTLLPQNEPYYVSVKLHFDTSPPYPRKPLKCDVKNNTSGLEPGNHMGLTEHQIKELQGEVDRCSDEAQKSRDLAVDRVIDFVKQYLFENNKKSYSLHDDMERTNKDQMEIEEIKLKESNLITIRGRNYDKRYPPCIQPGSKVQIYKDPLNTGNSLCLNVTCLTEATERGTFHAIDENFKPHLLHEFILDLSSVKLKTELQGIQKEFSRTQKLSYHACILKYIGLSFNVTNISNVVHVLTGCAYPLSGFDIGPYANTKKLAKELVSGLQFLHNQDIMHGVLSIDSIFVNSQGRHLIADYGFARHLLSNSFKAPFKKFSLKFPDAVKESGRFLDVLLLGHLLYHVSVGRKPDSAYPSPPSYLDPSLLDFIKLCVTEDKSYRAVLGRLFEHDFIGEPVLQIAQPLEEPTIQFSTGTGTGTLEDQASEDDSEQPWRKSPRITNEFDVKGVLGRGGFGSVIKARNKIDGSFYAMKVVQLPRASQNAIQSMREEVKLLSQLKHNNIVRYNSVWIEAQTIRDPLESSTDTTASKVSESSRTGSSMPSLPSSEGSDDWGAEMSFQPSQAEIRSRYHEEFSSDSDEEFDEDEEDDDSDDIVFEHSYKPSGIDASQLSDKDSESPSCTKIVMFIQMEFCENTTLRTLICNEKLDPPLKKDPDLVLRLLRQIVDALEYIHIMNIIHRDLKPENIFLDAKNNVKIGDFGLAVTGGYGKGGSNYIVGTSLYIAPEVKARRLYSPLNDIYSLGIICFEMVHGPFTTKTERCFVLEELRKPHIGIDDGVFTGEKFSQLELLVRNMLSHDLKVRKKASELSRSDILPPRLAQQGLQEILRHISSEHGSQRRNQFIDCLFSKDIANRGLSQYQLFDEPDTQDQDIQFTRSLNDIIDRMMPIFQKHGAVQCPLPFLLPKCDVTDQQDRPFVFLSKSGHYQVLPCNLKLNLAKHVLTSNIRDLKRYGFTQVFRKRVNKTRKQDPNPNPRDILEGSFDIISSGSNLTAKAEVFLVLIDVLKAIPEYKTSNVTIYVNHTKIMRSILLYYKIEEVYHNEILKYIYEFYQNDTKLEEALKNYSKLNSLNDRQVSSILTLLKCEGPIDLIVNIKQNDPKRNDLKRNDLKQNDPKRNDLKRNDFDVDMQNKPLDNPIHTIRYKSGRKIGNPFKEGLKEILQVLLLVTSSGLGETEDILDPEKKLNELTEKLSLCDSYKNSLQKMVRFRAGVINDPNCYSNFMFKVVVQSPDSKRADTIAVGGDFKELLEQWKSVNDNEFGDGSEEALPSAFGVNFLLEDMVNTIKNPYKTKIVIVSAAGKDNSVQIFSFMKSLWDRGIRTELSYSDDKSMSHAYHVVTFAKDSITIDSDKSYLRSLGIKEDKKFKAFKIDEALKYLIEVESKFDQLEAMRKQKASARQRHDSVHNHS